MRDSADVMTQATPKFATQIARTDDEINAALRLRYDVFVAELGGDGPLVDHTAQLEQDVFDRHADHIILLDKARAGADQVIGVYRVMTAGMAQAAGRFYCAEEYDLTPLYNSGKRLLELGRSCLHPDYRGGPAMMHLWAGLADYAQARKIDLLFGVASFHGTDVAALTEPLSLLHHRHLAREALRVKAIGPTALSMNIIQADRLDRVSAVRQMPALIKAYLRLGGTVGDGAFVDHDFNTVDVCLILESDAISGLQRRMLTMGAADG
ncbi:ornithine-acyl[acyl carrier protein] N-acyltransferase [Yoonia maricola]|uniref:L-ornithine N(alpha)-acyltransferase n=1 Tax=Yoonia maricola TaxID=420999 RepID=A0A2M8WLI3_9RHOB|nr:GNAT family N-acyltransferase [Yoonia maricola]PJI91787.1 ornithine-acyl[acyl carrier protein] N-acyltransferase [Yoonia maricola]